MDVASITAREGALEPRRNILAAKFALQDAPRSLARTHWLAFLFCHSLNCSGLPHGNPLSQNWTHGRTDGRAPYYLSTKSDPAIRPGPRWPEPLAHIKRLAKSHPSLCKWTDCGALSVPSMHACATFSALAEAGRDHCVPCTHCIHCKKYMGEKTQNIAWKLGCECVVSDGAAKEREGVGGSGGEFT